MCLENKCFSFSNFINCEVAVFISGCGNLEYPWALETALRLKNAGAKITIYDISNYSLNYSARIKLFDKQLPIVTRKILRTLLLKKNSRIEERVARICATNGITYINKHSKKFSKKFFLKKKIKISTLNNVMWGSINAKKIVHSHLSSKYKRNLKDDDFIPLLWVLDIKDSIMTTLKFIESVPTNQFSHFFICNGRQPVQAALTTFLRGQGKEVFLYESGGGYMFPTLSSLCIDYWKTNPANYLENHSKIMCPQNSKKINQDLTNKIISSLLTKELVPYSLNFLSENPTEFDLNKLGKGNNYAFFANSDWEFSLLQDDRQRLAVFEDQVEAVENIVKNLHSSDKLFIRLHPSDPSMMTPHEDHWNRFNNFDNIEIIDSESRLNSYELAHYMKINFVWESFIGFELAIRNLPVAIMSERAAYAPCIPENCIATEEKLKIFLKNPTVPRVDLLANYANYLGQGGFPIQCLREAPKRKIFLLDEQVDLYKAIFAWAPDRLWRKIS